MNFHQPSEHSDLTEEERALMPLEPGSSTRMIQSFDLDSGFRQEDDTSVINLDDSVVTETVERPRTDDRQSGEEDTVVNNNLNAETPILTASTPPHSRQSSPHPTQDDTVNIIQTEESDYTALVNLAASANTSPRTRGEAADLLVSSEAKIAKSRKSKRKKRIGELTIGSRPKRSRQSEPARQQEVNPLDGTLNEAFAEPEMPPDWRDMAPLDRTLPPAANLNATIASEEEDEEDMERVRLYDEEDFMRSAPASEAGADQRRSRSRSRSRSSRRSHTRTPSRSSSSRSRRVQQQIMDFRPRTQAPPLHPPGYAPAPNPAPAAVQQAYPAQGYNYQQPLGVPAPAPIVLRPGPVNEHGQPVVPVIVQPAHLPPPPRQGEARTTVVYNARDFDADGFRRRALPPGVVYATRDGAVWYRMKELYPSVEVAPQAVAVHFWNTHVKSDMRRKDLTIQGHIDMRTKFDHLRDSQMWDPTLVKQVSQMSKPLKDREYPFGMVYRRIPLNREWMPFQFHPDLNNREQSLTNHCINAVCCGFGIAFAESNKFFTKDKKDIAVLIERCVFCNGNHPSSGCPSLRSPLARRRECHRQHRCVACLGRLSDDNHTDFEMDTDRNPQRLWCNNVGKPGYGCLFCGEQDHDTALCNTSAAHEFMAEYYYSIAHLFYTATEQSQEEERRRREDFHIWDGQFLAWQQSGYGLGVPLARQSLSNRTTDNGNASVAWHNTHASLLGQGVPSPNWRHLQSTIAPGWNQLRHYVGEGFSNWMAVFIRQEGVNQYGEARALAYERTGQCRKSSSTARKEERYRQYREKRIAQEKEGAELRQRSAQLQARARQHQAQQQPPPSSMPPSQPPQSMPPAVTPRWPDTRQQQSQQFNRGGPSRQSNRSGRSSAASAVSNVHNFTDAEVNAALRYREEQNRRRQDRRPSDRQ